MQYQPHSRLAADGWPLLWVNHHLKLSEPARLSELKLDVCHHVYGWRHLVKATEVTCLAESNGRLPPGGWLSHLSATDPTLGNEYGYGRTFHLFSTCAGIMLYKFPVLYFNVECCVLFCSPSVNPPKEITDPEDKKPADWDERERYDLSVMMTLLF